MTKWREMSDEQRAKAVARLICRFFDGELEAQSAFSRALYAQRGAELLDKMKQLGAFDGWPEPRPMEDAPDDGRPFLAKAFDDLTNEYFFTVASWRTGKWAGVQETQGFSAQGGSYLRSFQWWPLPEQKP